MRDCSAEALGTLMKLVGEKAIGPFLVELEKDNLKMTKIKECCDKAVITVKVASKKERPTTAPNKAGGEPVKNGTAPKAVKRPPGSAPVKKKAAGVTSGTATIVKSKGMYSLFITSLFSSILNLQIAKCEEAIFSKNCSIFS